MRPVSVAFHSTITFRALSLASSAFSQETSPDVEIGGKAADAVRVATHNFRKSHRYGLGCFKVQIHDDVDETTVKFTANTSAVSNSLPNDDTVLIWKFGCERANLDGAFYRIDAAGKIVERHFINAHE